MLFNSVEFFIFFPLVFVVYWLLRGIRAQNIFLIIASYVFYGFWDWRFLSLIFISSLVDFLVGQRMRKAKAKSLKKRLLAISLLVNLGILGFFKYFNFFIDSFAELMTMFGLQVNQSSLNVILPVGISFYTFQTLSYTIDIYRGKIKPTKDIVAFFAFVSFFPQLVAGPIERAKSLLPQFRKKRKFNKERATDGFRQILWGFFKKVVVADTCAEIVDICFANPEAYGSSTLFIGAICFAFQIYGDFSGYSDIAIGTARILGFDLMRNFAYPYFSRDIAEFWRRWHISLSTWFRDYVYIPLGGSYGSTATRIRNIMITFVVSGFWHGANWTFIIWGFLNGLFYIPLMLLKKQHLHRENIEYLGVGHAGLTAIKVLLTFALTVLAWVFFRAQSVGDAFSYIGNIFSFQSGRTLAIDEATRIVTWSSIAAMLLLEWFQRTREHGLAIEKWHPVLRWSLYVVIALVCLIFHGQQQTFIYFQF